MTAPEIPIPSTSKEFTDEELAVIHADLNARFTADDLYGYIEDTEKKYTAEDVIQFLGETIRCAEKEQQSRVVR